MIRLIDASTVKLSKTAFSFKDILTEISEEYSLRAIGCIYQSKKTNYLVSNLSPELNNYFIGNYCQKDDLFLPIMEDIIAPYDWSIQRNNPEFIDRCARSPFFNILDNAITYPIHCPNAIASVSMISTRSNSEWTRFIATNSPKLFLSASHLVQSMRRYLSLDCKLNSIDVRLTTKELDALRIFYKTISVDQNQSFSSDLDLHLKRAKHKLQASSNTHALVNATHLGLL